MSPNWRSAFRASRLGRSVALAAYFFLSCAQRAGHDGPGAIQGPPDPALLHRSCIWVCSLPLLDVPPCSSQVAATAIPGSGSEALRSLDGRRITVHGRIDPGMTQTLLIDPKGGGRSYDLRNGILLHDSRPCRPSPRHGHAQGIDFGFRAAFSARS